MYVINT